VPAAGTRANHHPAKPSKSLTHSVNKVNRVSRVFRALCFAGFALISFSNCKAQAGAEHATQNAISVQELLIPAKARVHLDRAIEQFHKMKLAAATAEVQRALGIDPACAQAFTMKALIELASHDSSNALTDASEAARLDPHDAKSFLVLATANNSRDRYGQAEVAARQAVKIQPDLWQARLEIAKALYGQQKYPEALGELESIKIDFADIHLVRANLLMRLGRSQEGAAEFAAFLDKAPHDSRTIQIREIIATANSESPVQF
jgi:tetratricopeptide (TPR) repeat protein